MAGPLPVGAPYPTTGHLGYHDALHGVVNDISGGTTGQVLKKNSGDRHDFGWTALPLTPVIFGITGTLTAGAGKSRLVLPASPTGTWALQSVTVSVNTAPTGAALIVDVNRNGTTIFGTQANRPTIAASGFAATVAASQASVTSYAAGDYLTIDVDQIGSTIPGADLVVAVWLTV